ncbi:MAG TPA: winged helix-turn-helix transcriptional regulator [Candidatus Saccharimonadales bacterium]|nr:winged helix-turn-helix transcriptional regulator [Candidatus Saccharimonadales bacterium]
MRRSVIIDNKKLDLGLDHSDIRIINLMVLNKTNKEISQELEIPLSTIQRRVRNLITAGYITSDIQVNYEKMGFKSGLLHIYLKNGNIDEMVKKVNNLDQITSIEVHIGNSDIVGQVVYKEGKDLLNLISTIKKMEGVERVVWSERVYQSPSKGNKNIIVNMLNSHSK